jgi:2-polyprenyl-6-methoxyphenol hydroxylase-like FAD-dependent oxidoreductase
MTSIGIVGTGISGVQLALTLQQAGIDTTVYAERTPDELRRTRLPNGVVRHFPALARERALGVDHWAACGSRIDAIDVSILGTPIAFRGHLEAHASGVDFRVYLPRLLEDYAARGGHVVTGRTGPDDVVAASAGHDLTVVASGRESIKAFFPRDPERSPFAGPQRLLCAVLVNGVAALQPGGVSFSIAPGVGEIFTLPFHSHHGLVTVIGIEAIPGGPLEAITHASYDDDPQAFEALLARLLREYAPPVYERLDPGAFGVCDAMDVLQGAITPTVRRASCEVASGRFVVAVGDAYVTNDPICGQGANLASATAAVLADAICKDVAYDAWFCDRVERDLWAVAEPVTNFNNSFLAAPYPHVEEILGAATMSQPVADAFCRNFADPAAMWRAIATPERAAAFLAGVGRAPALALAS